MIQAAASRKPSELSFSRTMEFEYGVPQEVAPGARRIVANNPGPFTFKGTNTYLAGRGAVAVIDPGPDDEAHRQAIFKALRGETITHILITHTHRDHTDGVAALKEATGAQVLAYGPTEQTRGAALHPVGQTFVDSTLEPDQRLRHGDTVKGAGWALDVLHTPGHAPDHLCFGLVGQRVVFSGDHVMGWNTTVVAPPEGDMGDYMASLELLLRRRDRLFLPGHGERIEAPQRAVKAYIMHRKWREAGILACLQDGCRTSPEIVARIYADLQPSLVVAAELSVLAHLEHMNKRGLVRMRPGDSPPREGPAALRSEFAPA